MKNIGTQPLSLPARAPVMVLPGVQLFPHAVLPLFIFEPRYRAMLASSLEQERMFCLAPLKPGLSDAHTSEDFQHTVGIGLVRASVQREDGTSHLMLQGLARVRLTRFVQDAPFWIAELEELPSEPAAPHEVPALAEKLRSVCSELRAGGMVFPESLEQQLETIQEPGVLADVIAQTLLQDAVHRQDIFEELRVGERLRLLTRHLTAEML